ncbi:MAG: Ig-like domain-containing protein [Candidatus Uhrbacteria bacterium]
MKKNRLLITAVGIATVAFLLFLPFHSFAADLVTNELSTVGETSGLATIELGILVARIIRIVLGVLGVIMVCLIIYAGWLYFTSQGEEKNTKKAKDIIKTTIIGLLIILSAYSIATFVLNYLLEAAGLNGGISTTTAQNFNEPLAGSLGSGIIESHYPARDATEIPRNTRIYVTFKEAIKVDTIMVDDDGVATTPNVLNAANVTIAPTDIADGVALTGSQVQVAVTADHKTFSFDPTVLLGSDTTEMNYTVTLGTGIKKVLPNGSFAGAFDSEGYAWQFEVSTEVDLTPPQVVSVVPADLSPLRSTEAPNIIVAITFNEAMDPIAASGTYTGVTPLPADSPPEFTNIKVLKNTTDNTAGTYSVSNVYRTVEFVPTEICGSDPCGNDIFCLPRNVNLDVVAKAAALSTDPPQAAMTDEGLFNGLVDAAGNSLDGNRNGIADGPGSPSSLDNYEWGFTTEAEPRTDVPAIFSVGPTVNQGQVTLNQNVTINFDSLMQSSTLNSTNIRLLPDFVQAFWYQNSNAENPGSVADVITTPSSFDDNFTVVTINHATFWESDNGTEDSNGNGRTGDLYSYYPVITNGVKSAWQICMSPANGPKEDNVTSNCGGANSGRYCCNGVASLDPCTFTGVTISQ